MNRRKRITFSIKILSTFSRKWFIFHQKSFPKVHDVKRIATLIEPFEKNIFDLEEEFNVLNKYYATTRYPGDFPEGFSWTMAREAFEAAVSIKEFVLKRITK